MKRRGKNGKKSIVCLMVIGTALCLSACGEKRASAQEELIQEGSKNTVNDTVPNGKEDWNPDIIQRQILVDEGAVCGVFFLGYVEESIGDLGNDREYYQMLFEEQGYLENFPFLAEIPDSSFVETEHGQELYCIIPADPDAAVSVNQWIVDADNGFEGKTEEVLYRSEEGTPILLKCNASELVSDAELVIVDSNGDQVKWSPSLSGIDGSVFVESADGAVSDLTFYDGYAGVDLLHVMAGQKVEYHWDEEYETAIACCSRPLVKLGEYEADAYPELAKNLAANLETRKSKIFSQYERIIESAEQDYVEYAQEYKISESAMIRRADSHVLSILFDGFLFEGGIHGEYYYWGENYDTETGRLLKLTDVVDNIGEFSELVKEQLYAHWEEESFYVDFDFEQYFKENLNQIPWILDYQGITVYFNPFEIAPYATGVFAATVAFDAKPELFYKEYTETPDSYGIQLDMEIPFYYDVDADGELDEVFVYGIPNDSDYIVHNVHVDLESYVEFDENELYAYRIDRPHLLHMADGRNYLLIENLTDNDYRTNTIYELTSGIPVKVDTVLSGMHTALEEEEGLLYKDVLTNPYSFKMDSRTWCVGTYDGYQTYYLGEDGFPISYENYYTFEHMPEFTVLKDFNLQLISEYGEAGERVTVKKGEIVKYYHTDSSDFADFVLSDGRIGRADLEWFEGSCLIDGTAAAELFDGIIFAG